MSAADDAIFAALTSDLDLGPAADAGPSGHVDFGDLAPVLATFAAALAAIVDGHEAGALLADGPAEVLYRPLYDPDADDPELADAETVWQTIGTAGLDDARRRGADALAAICAEPGPQPEGRIDDALRALNDLRQLAAAQLDIDAATGDADGDDHTLAVFQLAGWATWQCFEALGLT